MLGVALAGHPLSRYLEFPPRTPYVDHAPFSWAAFALFAALFALLLLPMLVPIVSARGAAKVPAARSFPWWGWAGGVSMALSWTAAWTRLPLLAAVQDHTFTPLWLSYIVVVNAVTVRRTGTCPMLADPGRFARLFAASAAFWWLFEFLNRFVQNWIYEGVREYAPWEYVLAATVPFSTVLPAVLSTRDLLSSFPRVTIPFRAARPFRLRHPRAAAAAALALSAAGLAGIGVWPNLLFPLLWLSPLLILVSLQALHGEETVLSGIAGGDWTGVVPAALAALLCGFFWEMWNFFSQARWVYEVPYVNRFRIFEMPVLGYAGYLPFGLECAAAAALFRGSGEGAPGGTAGARRSA